MIKEMIRVTEKDNFDIPKKPGCKTIAYKCFGCSYDNCDNYKAIEKGYCYAFIKE